MRKYNVAILGATGAVGVRMVDQLAKSTIPVKSLKLLASSKSAGKKMKFKDQQVTVEEATPDSFNGVDLVLASPGSSVSARLLPEAVKRGAVCVDNSSNFRMDPKVPLVIPEVNPEQLKNHKGIVANPNCSTIQMLVALNPIREKFGLKQIIVSTYQAAAGAGHAALEEFYRQAQEYLDGKPMEHNILPTGGDKKHYPLAFNLLPQIDVFQEHGYTHEEWKMVHETKKIMLNDMNSPKIKVNATCVRVPVPVAHGETVYFETDDQNVTADQIKKAVDDAPGATLQDDPAHQVYPQPLNAVGKRETFVGRIRPDLENKGSFDMWVVADNLLKGAAWNTVENAEELVKRDLVHVPDDYYKA
ncbi:aspartate-semialdehyde dehydrogenase [Philodulcilactobacillus myokoensis]|uniref:Aspartate-semialdehyde dehydrogenase n=1 Tax=Philodulcilactobacillus myokoensis TaxID=2929573 RepID=A0A9W6ERT5_9LACO|nr:aspartate-semialdehyde dehydrogenase [Philodulcilactobacillus myokoensis]GLB46536.1 aspartate-semialdehyde dehydrogenase [Philodulcilactobacillus myokoensis]